VRVVDLSSGTALDTRPARTFATGTYFVWKVRGHVSIQITNTAGSSNAVVSALLIALASGAPFAGYLPSAVTSVVQSLLYWRANRSLPGLPAARAA
jgi:hypothetical protein